MSIAFKWTVQILSVYFLLMCYGVPLPRILSSFGCFNHSNPLEDFQEVRSLQEESSAFDMVGTFSVQDVRVSGWVV